MRDKKGFMTLSVVLWSVVLIPVFLFFAIDFPYFVYERSRLKGITDNMASSAVTMISDELIPFGIIEIDEEQAIEMSNKIMRKSLLLDNSFNPTQRSNLTKKPTVNILVYNDIPESGTIKHGIFLQNPTVIIQAEYSVKGLVFRRLSIPIRILSSAQAQFR